MTFIDLAGHGKKYLVFRIKKIIYILFSIEKYLKTTVFGMTGHAPDYAMLMVRK